MSSDAAELASVWLPIKTAISARMRKFALLCIKHETADFGINAIIRRDQQLMSAVRGLPAHVIDQVREEFPLTPEQLQLWHEHIRHRGMFLTDYNTF